MTPKRFVITWEDHTIYQAVKYFDSEDECRVWADNVDYWDPTTGCHSVDSSFIDMEIRESDPITGQTMR